MLLIRHASFGLIAAFSLLCAAAGASVSAEESVSVPKDGGYARILSRYVNDAGLVRYRELALDRAGLDAYVTSLSQLPGASFDRLSKPDRTAFLVNAYNARTLQTVLDHYPIKSGFARALVYPKNSIRQIPGVWDKLRFPLRGRDVTLDEVEHEMLRKELRDPRVHMAVNCASIGCPPLRREPYRASSLDSQLDDQGRRVFSPPYRYRLDKDAGVMHVSSIFKWFPEDFRGFAEPPAASRNASEPDRSLIAFAARYVSEADRAFLETHTVSVSYLDYDWTLNEERQ